jgi:hypothetical protein
MTFEWFTEELCDESQLVTLNVFDKKSMKWKNKLEIKEKFRNFHGCTLVQRLTAPAREAKYEKFNNYKLEGLLPEISRAIAKVGNFSIFFQLYNGLRNLTGQGLHAHFLSEVTSVGSQSHIAAAFEEFTTIFVITPGKKCFLKSKKL